jgi:hypothetical protein
MSNNVFNDIFFVGVQEHLTVRRDYQQQQHQQHQHPG